MSRGIIRTALESDEVFSQHARELLKPQHEISSEQPTLADLVLPGSGHSFSDEFACLLRVLGAGESA
jgi:hypothetical protein